MSKLRLNLKQWLSLGLASLVSATCVGCSQAPESEISTNTIGYSNVSTIGYWNVDEDNFVLLDIGDHDTVETHHQDKKMRKCNEEDISLGIIISSDAADEASIYDDVEYVKGIVRDYKVDFPVYLNIDKIITNDGLNIETKTKIIKNFLEKCSSNNIYVGVHGTDTNLCRLKKYCNITGYDALVVKEKDKIDYDGTYLVYQELDGTYVAKEDLSEVIVSKGLNDSKGFSNDGSYTISNESELTDVALHCGMSVNELLEFNGLKKNNIGDKTILRNPSTIGTIPANGDVEFQTLDEPFIGCDMSQHQGTDVNWEAAAEIFDFMILRSNTGLTKDSCFDVNAQQATLANIPIGVYAYSGYRSITENFLEKHSELTDYTIEILQNKKIEYPVYLDIEEYTYYDDAGNKIKVPVDATTFTKEDVQNMIEIWTTKMKAAGYIPGLYCNQTAYEFLASCVDYDLSEKLEVWIAGGYAYGNEYNESGHKDYAIEELSYNKTIEHLRDSIKGKPNVIQCTNTAVVTTESNGQGEVVAGNNDNHLDINFSKVDFSKRKYAGEAPTFDIKEFSRTDWDVVLGNSIGVAVLGGGTILGVHLLKKKKTSLDKPKVKVKSKEQ